MITTDPQSGPAIQLTFTLHPSGIDEAPTLKHTIRLPLHTAWEIVEVIQLLGPARALTFAAFAVYVSNTGQEVPYPHGDEVLKMQAAINHLANMFGHRWESLEDRVIAFTYQFLRHTDMTRKMAAQFASTKLPKHYTEDAWRKQVDRWVVSHKLPPIGKSKRLKKRLEGIKQQ